MIVDDYEKYTVLGVDAVIVLSSKSHEETGGYEVEHTQESLAVTDGNTYSTMEVTWTNHPLKLLRHVVSNQRSITKAEYDKLGLPVDIAKIRDAKRAEYAKQQAILAAAPNCPKPKCKAKMVLRYGSHGQFWGCPNYPKCKGTRKYL